MVTKAWCKWVPPRVQFTVWLALLRKLHTRDRLVRRNVLNEDQNICPICHREAETDAHLLLQCQYTRPVWVEAMQVWRVEMILPNDPPTLFKMWLDTHIKGRLPRRA